jgi:cytosine deaminase
VLVAGGRIVNVSPRIDATAAEVVDAHGYLLAPRSSTFPHGCDVVVRLPRVNQSGTLLEGIALWES